MICSHVISSYLSHFMIFMVFSDFIDRNPKFMYFPYLNFMLRMLIKRNYSNLHHLNLLNSLVLSQIFDYFISIMIFYFFLNTIEGIDIISALDIKIKSEFYQRTNHLWIALGKFRMIFKL
jgi:hypothetical protein